MERKLVFHIILGAALVSGCLAAPNLFSFFTPQTKEIRVEPRVEVVRGPSYMVQGGPTHVIQGGPPHVIHGGPPHLVQGPPVLVGHMMQPPPPPPPPPPPVFQPGGSHQCICTQPSNCRKIHGLHRCSEGKVNFNNIGPEVCCPTPDVIC